jgi:hypothetical protein
MRVKGRLLYALFAGVFSLAAGCGDLFGPDRPDVTVSLDVLTPTVSARALRVAIGNRSTEVPAPPAGGTRTEQQVRGQGFGTQSVQVALVGSAGDTLAVAAFPQHFERHTRHWIAGLVGRQRPLGTCVGMVATAPVRGTLADTLFVMYGGLPDGATC